MINIDYDDKIMAIDKIDDKIDDKIMTK